MCVDPVTATILATTGASALGSIMEAKGQQNVERANADRALLEGYQNESMQRNKASRDMAMQVATLSMRNASLSSGSPLALAAESARASELDALQLRANGVNKAQAHDYNASVIGQTLPLTIAGKMLGGASKLASLGKI